MRLHSILEGIKIKRMPGAQPGHANPGQANPEITGISFDSRSVLPGNLFVALKGTRMDGGQFIKDALGKGAAAVIAEGADANSAAQANAIFIEVDNARGALARVSANFYSNPARKLKITGITGTNGKTTTSLLIKSALESLGLSAGLIGTIAYEVGGKRRPAPFTTPEAPLFQSMLAEMVREGVTHLVTEVSSHALAQKRVDEVEFDAAVFSNLTRDHLDFHKTMEDYYQAKKRLFTDLLKPGGAAAINADDPYGQRLLRELGSGNKKTLAYGIDARPISGVSAFAKAQDVELSTEGTSFVIGFEGEKIVMEKENTPLIGLHNVSNMLAAFCALVGLGFDTREAAKHIAALHNVTGRFEKVDVGQDFTAVIDYAHTPDALQRLIMTARALAKGRIITVFGCGGDRDRGKRPEMGQIATILSDFAVITSDNPRSEDPALIINEITNGVAGENFVTVPDRAEAIACAIDMALPQDIVLIAGKGHEDYQEIKGTRRHFSDREAAAAAIEKKMKGKHAQA